MSKKCTELFFCQINVESLHCKLYEQEMNCRNSFCVFAQRLQNGFCGGKKNSHELKMNE